MATMGLNTLIRAENPEYRRLYRQHQDLELRLEGRVDRHGKFGMNAVETRRIKKRKLVLKDRMATIAQEYNSQQSPCA